MFVGKGNDGDEWFLIIVFFEGWYFFVFLFFGMVLGLFCLNGVLIGIVGILFVNWGFWFNLKWGDVFKIVGNDLGFEKLRLKFRGELFIFKWMREFMC